MKRTQLVLSVLALGLTGLAQANPFPADAEASYSLPASSSWAEKHAGSSGAQSGFPSDAEAIITVQGRGSYVEKHAGDPVKERSESQIAFVNLDD